MWIDRIAKSLGEGVGFALALLTIIWIAKAIGIMSVTITIN